MTDQQTEEAIAALLNYLRKALDLTKEDFTLAE